MSEFLDSPEKIRTVMSYNSDCPVRVGTHQSKDMADRHSELLVHRENDPLFQLIWVREDLIDNSAAAADTQ